MWQAMPMCAGNATHLFLSGPWDDGLQRGCCTGGLGLRAARTAEALAACRAQAASGYLRNRPGMPHTEKRKQRQAMLPLYSKFSEKKLTCSFAQVAALEVAALDAGELAPRIYIRTGAQVIDNGVVAVLHRVGMHTCHECGVHVLELLCLGD